MTIKRKNRKKIYTLAFTALALLGLGVGAATKMETQSAAAATYTTAKYTTYGSTNNGSSISSGCPSNFTIYMYGSSQSGTATMYQDALTNWSYYNIYIDASKVSDHRSFVLRRNGSSYYTKSVSGESDMYLYQGSLPDGEYELEYTCRYAKNIFYDYTYYTYTYRFEVDKTSPSYTLKAGGSTISSGSYTNKQIVYTASDTNFNYIKYRKPSASSYSTYYSTSYTVSATSSNNGWWYFYAADDLTQTNSTVSVYLDTVLPVGKVTNASGTTMTNGGYASSAIKYTASDSGSGVYGYQYKKPGATSWSSYTSGTAVTGTGWHTWRSYDRAYNYSEEYKVYYDATAPTGTLYGGTTTKSSGSYTNASYVKYVASDSESGVAACYVKMPGSSSYTAYTSGTQLTTDGTYYFYSVNKSGISSSTVAITKDTVKPSGTLYAGTTSVSSGAKANAAYVKFVPSDAIGVKATYVMKPNTSTWVAYTSGTQLTAEGYYQFKSEDYGSNVSQIYTVTLDRTAPTATLYAGTTAVSSGTYTNAAYVKYVASGGASGVSGCYVKLPGNSYFSAYTSGTQLTGEGQYTFYSVNGSNVKSAEVTITLDKTAPTGTLYAGTSVVTSGTRTNASEIKFTPSDNIGIKTVYVKKPNSSSFVTYDRSEALTEEGEYAFYAVDKSLNESQVYTITIDRNIPAAQLFVDDIAVGNNTYTNGAHIRFECEETCYVKTPGKDEFGAYVTGMEYYKPGRYEFYGLSEAGNSTGVYVIIIDRESKPLTINNVVDGVTDGDVTITWTDGDSSTTAPIKTVTVNGLPYRKGSPIYTIDTASYIVVCVDSAGNEWTAEFKSTKQNVLTETFQKEYYEAADKDGNYYTFSTYDSALAFAIARENEFVRTGTWTNASWDTGIAMDTLDSVNAVNGTYYIYKKSGNAEEEVAYFTKARLDEVITEYAKVGIEDYYYWEKEYAPIAEGENLFSYSDGKTILANAITLGENIGCMVDGEEFVGTEYLTEGNHVLTVSDAWGNTCDYAITVIRRAPDIQYAVGEGGNNLVSFDRTYYFKDCVTVSIVDVYDEMAMFSVYDKNEELLGNFSLEDAYTIEESGRYTVKAVNHYGESQVFSFVVSRNAPTIAMNVNETEKKLEISIAESIDAESNIKTLELYKSVDGGNTWTAIEQDDYGTVVMLGTYAYKFRTSGFYKVVLTDEFRTGIDVITKELDYVQAIPVGVLQGVENEGYTNGDVSFTWTDEAVVTLTKDGDGIEYKSGDLLSEDGAYILTFENFDGYKAVYSFVIDKEKPEVFLEGGKANLSVKTDVKVNFDAEGQTAVLFKDGKEVGAYLPGTPIEEIGAYRVLVTDLALNQTEISFVIDKIVDCDINVNNGGAANSVTLTANEDVEIVFTKDGEAAEYVLGSEITVPGFYELKITDMLGNVKEIGFTIVESKVQEFTFNFDNTPNFEKALVNGEEKRLNYGTLELFEDGTYEVGVVAGGKTYTFTVEVDNTAPTLTITGVENEGATKDSVVLSDLSEEAELKVFRNDVEIEYKLGDTLTEVGEYRIELRDGFGNETTYTFTIEKSFAWAWIALGVIGILAIGGVLTFLILKKKKVV